MGHNFSLCRKVSAQIMIIAVSVCHDKAMQAIISIRVPSYLFSQLQYTVLFCYCYNVKLFVVKETRIVL